MRLGVRGRLRLGSRRGRLRSGRDGGMRQLSPARRLVQCKMIHARIHGRPQQQPVQEMLIKADQSTLVFPAPEPPAPGQIIEIAPGILWARIPLPFRLNHINVYLIDDGDGWAMLDTGIGNDATRAVWEALIAGPLAGRRADAPDRHALPPRPYRPRRLAVRALRPAAADEPDQLPGLPQHLAQPRRARRQALSRLLPAPRARRGDDPARRHAGPRLSARWCRACRRPSSASSRATRSRSAGAASRC